MDFELSEDQAAILEAVETLLERHAGPARAIELAPKGEYDQALDAALQESGFHELLQGDETGPLEALLVTEAIARSCGVVAFASAALVAPGAWGRSLPGPVALAVSEGTGLVRFGAHARTLLVLEPEDVRLITLQPGDAQPVRSSFGYPMGRVPTEGGESLGPEVAKSLRSWWRLALAAEVAGTMDAALQVTVEYVKQRRQFGRAIGSFQAVQHRLAECCVRVEGSRWLAREAAYRGAPEEATAAAAAYAVNAADRVFTETHQLSGAIGYTREHDLHAWSMRLQALRLELDGLAGHRRALARARWLST